MAKKQGGGRAGVLTRESSAGERLPEIVRRLRRIHPDACCALDHRDPFQLLVSVILSAQCTDVRVNQVTPVLFEKYPTIESLAAADRSDIEAIILPTGFFRQKARFIQESCQAIIAEHGGQVPDEMAALLSLTGVARKSANVILGVAFGKAEGVVVDTHVTRLSRRLGLSEQSSPEKIEQELMALVPRSEWIDFAHLLIFHGRRVCYARKPDCVSCALGDLCPAAEL